METAEAFIKVNGHMIRHRYDAAVRHWVPAEPIRPRKPKPFAPMLAATFAGAVAFPVLAQPKIDGVRCIARASGMFSRDGNRFESLPHIEAVLAPLFRADPDLVIDGELWAEGMALGKIAGLARRAGWSPELRFLAFDIVSDSPPAERAAAVAAAVKDAGSDLVQAVPTTACETGEALDRHYAECLASGWEGQIIRLAGEGYRSGRSAAMQKRKPAEDAEAEIVAVDRDSGGKLVLTLRDDGGRTFKAPAPFGGSEGARYARMGAALIGLEATYRFVGHLPSGLPRDATVKLIHELPRL